MKLQLHPEAEEELFQGAAWYQDREAGLGDDLLAEVGRWFDVIAESPTTWPCWPGSPDVGVPIRRVVLDRFPYSIVYQAFPERVWVVAIAHWNKSPEYWMDRLDGAG